MSKNLDDLVRATAAARPAAERLRSSIFEAVSRLAEEHKKTDDAIQRIEEDRKRGSRLTNNRAVAPVVGYLQEVSVRDDRMWITRDSGIYAHHFLADAEVIHSNKAPSARI